MHANFSHLSGINLLQCFKYKPPLFFVRLNCSTCTYQTFISKAQSAIFFLLKQFMHHTASSPSSCKVAIQHKACYFTLLLLAILFLDTIILLNLWPPLILLLRMQPLQKQCFQSMSHMCQSICRSFCKSFLPPHCCMFSLWEKGSAILCFE